MEKRRYGKQDVHLEWEKKDAVRPLLEHAVNNMCGDMGDMGENNFMKRELINMLLHEKEFMEAVGQAKNIMEAENKDSGPYDIPEIYKLIGKSR